MFDIYEKKLNAITKKYDSVLLEQITPEAIINDAASKARAGLAATNNKSKESNVYSIKELRDILDSLLKTGFNNVDQSELKVIQRWADFALFGGSSDNPARWSLVAKIRSGALGPNRNQLWKDATQLTKLILEFSSKTNLGGIDTSIEAAGFSYEQLVQAYQDAKSNNISLLTALRKIKPDIKRNDLESIFNYVATEFKNQADKLKKYDEELVTKVDNIRNNYLNDPTADAETLRVVPGLTYYDGLRKDLKHPAYKEVYDYTQNVYLPKVGSILRTVNALGDLVKELQKYEREWQLNKDIQEFLDAMELWKGAEATRIRLEKLAKIKAGYEKFRDADTQSMENFYKQIPDLLWREVERVVNSETGDDPTGIAPKFYGRVIEQGTKPIIDKVKNYIENSLGDKTNLYGNFINIFRDKETFTSYVLEPKKREQAIFNLQDLYVNIKSMEDLIALQEDRRPVKIKFPNVPEMSLSVKDDSGQTINYSNFNVNQVINLNQIKSFINWFAVQLPNRISAYDQRAETSIGRAVTNIDFEALDQKAKSQAEQMLQSIERGFSAGEEELANREQIRQSAEDSVLQDKLRAAHQAASALAIQTQFNLRDEAISAQEERRKNVEQTLETLNLIISAIDVATNNVDNRSIKDIYEVTNYIGIVFQSIDGTYFEDDRITSTLNQIDTKFQDLLKAKLADISTQLDQSNDLAQVELEKTSNRDINEDVVTQLLQTLQESDLVTLKSAYPKGFVEFDLDTTAVEPKVTQLESSIAELNRRLERSNDPFFVLWYEIRDDIADLYKNKDNADLNNLLDVVEKLDELESLIDDDNMQLNYDNQLNSFETIVDIVVQLKLKEVASLVREFFPLFTIVDEKYVPKEGIDYSDFSSYVDLWELFKTIEEMYDALDLEPSELYIAIAKELSLIGSAIPLENIPFGGRSEEEFIDWITKYGPQSSGRGDGAIEVSGREEFRNTSFDEIGLPMYTDKGDYLGTETQRRKYIRNKAMNSTAKEVRVLLKKRRLTHFDSLPQFAGPGQARKDPYIKEIGNGMAFKDRNRFERLEVIHVTTGFMLDDYLDKYINLAGEHMPQLKPVEYGNEFDAPEFSGLSNEFD